MIPKNASKCYDRFAHIPDQIFLIILEASHAAWLINKLALKEIYKEVVIVEDVLT